MANAGPVQVPNNLSQLTSVSDVVRFLSAFCSQMAGQFNNSLSTRTVWGVIGISGGVTFGTGTFSVSLTAMGQYWVALQTPYTYPPAVTGTGHTTAYYTWVTGLTNTGFLMNLYDDNNNVLVNGPFSFIAVGGK